MPSRLSSLLVRDGLVTVKSMERAFQQQVVKDGALDTVLLEMEAVPEERLIQYLSLATGLPPASNQDTNSFDPEAIRRCPVAMAEKYRVVPLSAAKNTLTVLVHDPVDLQSLEELANALDCAIQPAVVPEYRFHILFDRMYGKESMPRFLHLAHVQGDVPAPIQISEAKAVVVDAGRAHPADTEEDVDRVVVDVTELPAAPSPEVEQQEAQARSKRESVIEDPEGERKGEAMLRPTEAIELLAKADDRDEIFTLLLRGLRSRAKYAALLTIKGDVAVGRVSIHAPDVEDDQIESVSISLKEESPYKQVATLGNPHIGPLATGNEAIDSMTRRMGGIMPATTLLLPISLRGRVMAIAVAHAKNESRWIATVPTLLPLAGHAADAVSRLLVAKSKGKATPEGKTGNGEFSPTATAAEIPAAPTTAPQSDDSGKRRGKRRRNR